MTHLPYLAALASLAAACHHPTPGPTITPTEHARVVALISATAEWKIIVAQFPGEALHETPFGPWLAHRIAGEDVVFFHGGYGKVSAAGSTQYAIDRWHPALLVNLGTCGGFGERKVGDIVLATETYIYDVVELMGNADEAIEDFHTRLDTRRWPARLASRVVAGTLVSADRDLDPASPPALQARYGASVGDWESGAIAWVAAHNRVPVIILRGVTDVIDTAGKNPTYNAIDERSESGGGDPAGSPAGRGQSPRGIDEWQRRSVAVMASLVSLLGEALPDLLK